MKRQSRPREVPKTTVLELMRAFLYLGMVAFGGPVAHIALMERELIEKRRWLSRQHFLDLLAVTNLVPGPNSTQMMMHVGFVRRKDFGTWVAGMCFILPAFFITLAISWFYIFYGQLPALEAAFYGIKPIVVVIIANALYRLLPDAVTGWRTGVIFAGSLVLGYFGVSELTVMAMGAVTGLLIYGELLHRHILRGLLFLPVGHNFCALQAAGKGAENVSLVRVGLLFIRFGSILYGSGYLLIAFIRNDLVNRLGWLTSEQLLDCIAIGQMTPGPILTTSTAVGYITAGVPGAVVATAGIFLPSFFFVMLVGRFISRLRESEIVRGALKGLTAAVVAVMLTVTFDLALDALVDAFTVLLAGLAMTAMIRFKIDALLLVGLSALAGYLWVVMS